MCCKVTETSQSDNVHKGSRSSRIAARRRVHSAVPDDPTIIFFWMKYSIKTLYLLRGQPCTLPRKRDKERRHGGANSRPRNYANSTVLNSNNLYTRCLLQPRRILSVILLRPPFQSSADGCFQSPRVSLINRTTSMWRITYLRLYLSTLIISICQSEQELTFYLRPIVQCAFSMVSACSK